MSASNNRNRIAWLISIFGREGVDTGGKVTTQSNMHLTKNVYIGETKADGQFKILKSFNNVVGEPWLKGKFK